MEDTTLKRFRPVKHWLQWFALRAIVWILRAIPLPARAAMLALAARAAGTFAFEGRSRRNLKIAFGDGLAREQRREIRRANARSLGRVVAELIEYERRGARFASERVHTDSSLAFLDAALAVGRGAVVVTPHFGNWELFPSFLVSRGYAGAVVGRSPANPYFARALLEMRRRGGVQTFDSRGSPRPLLRTLREGGIVGMLPDLDSKHISGAFLPFFGRSAWTATGPAHLAIAAGAPLVTAYMIPEADRYVLSFEPALFPIEMNNRTDEVLRLSAAWSRRFQDKISAHPQLWVWMHDRFATTPEKATARRERARTKESAQ